ncbi:quinolinate synthase [Methylacidimicrobium cyclopophantes]|uniref:Quinolinate synthase n=1 Tax=Methylacidimicrobium cyclopophantes TaxID=1041766 RepID=A0A5E6M7R1_9BACT|nr:quinolinate synthase NadA [Methylacidimicrobium cyclopophantes]VVM05403.1 quinolinate synthase [Methylacidimicrobium cyclopophantes]
MEASQFQEEILRLKKERNAVILAHNYQLREIQEIADYVGDSLGLAYQANRTGADWIVFCGVHFMAETAKILNPEKKVLLPDLEAGCSLADSCSAEELAEARRASDRLFVVTYVNSTASVKALSDVICTSSNAVAIVNRIPSEYEILFVPDQNLGEWVRQQTGRKIRLWEGRCYVHVEFTHASLSRMRQLHPGAPIVAHPECDAAVRMLADEICSTEKMVGFCRKSPAESFIIATEAGMLHRLRREIPEKEFLPAPTERCACANCLFMKKITLEKVYRSLQSGEPEVVVPREIAERARIPIERMLDWSTN